MKSLTIDFPGLSFLEVRDQYKGVKGFYPQSWYEDEAFAKEVIPAGRYEVRLEPCTDSFNKTWEEQQTCLPDLVYEVPPAAVLCYAIMEHWRNTNERCFSDCWVRTNSIDSGGDRVYVGYFDADGLDVYSDWDDDRSSRLGVSAARKLKPGTLAPSESLESLSARIKELEAWKEKVISIFSHQGL